MPDPKVIKSIIEKSLHNAEAAGFGRTEQLEHALRALHQVMPEVGEEEARTAIRRVAREL